MPESSPSPQEVEDDLLVLDERKLLYTLRGIRSELARLKMTRRMAAKRITSLVKAADKKGLRYDYLSEIHDNIDKGWSDKYYVMDKIYFEGKQLFEGVDLDEALRRVEVRFHTHTSSE